MRTSTTLTPCLAAVAAIALGAALVQDGPSPSIHPRGAAVTDHDAHESPWEGVDRGVAVLHGTKGHEKIHGVIRFVEEAGDRVRVVADVYGLEPGSVHAIHVHEYGDCTAPDATSAGGHYNPEGHEHKLPDHETRHAGDLGNLPAADETGHAHYELVVDNITLTEMENPILGRAVIVHAERDTGQGATGEAGARIACGVIGIANPDAGE